jgi:putative AlgH/UPF0301 family transcriptional regulator
MDICLASAGWLRGRKVAMGRGSKWLAIFVLAAGWAGLAAGQAARVDQDKSSFLIAKRELKNPLFERAVVLMLPIRNEGLVVGLIVNRATQVSLSDAFPQVSEFKQRTDTVYFGGPVNTDSPALVFRSSKAFKEAFPLGGDLYVSFETRFIEGTLKKKPEQISAMRLFLGRSQWAPDQLRDEMEAGAWFGEQEENGIIFSAAIGDVWPKLIDPLEPGEMAMWEPMR